MNRIRMSANKNWMHQILNYYEATKAEAQWGWKSENTDFDHEFGTERGKHIYYEDYKVEPLMVVLCEFPVVDEGEAILDYIELIQYIYKLITEEVTMKDLKLKLGFTYQENFGDEVFKYPHKSILINATWTEK